MCAAEKNGEGLGRGDRLPRMVTPPPGPEARRLAELLDRYEAPGVNTLPAAFTADGSAGSKREASATPAILWREARGANVVDVDGNRYIDLTAGFGVAAVGHRHPRVVAAARRQAGVLLHALGDVHAHPLRIEVARRLGEWAPVDDPRVYFAVSGADAVEIALKTAALATGKSGVLCFDPGYHGLTLGALSVTSRPIFRQPFEDRLAPRTVHRLAYGCPATTIEQALGSGAIGAAIVEPVVGREGVLLPPRGWLTDLAALCRRHGVLFIADEVFTGFGRTGQRFAVDHEGVRPDLLCCGKALAGGLPLAATIGRAEVMEGWRTDGEALHTATHLANPVACACACAVLDLLEDGELARRARALGALLARRLARFNEFSVVSEVRGRGLLWGIEVDHRDTAYAWTGAALQQGLLVLAGGPNATVLQLCPPLTITHRQLLAALDVLTITAPGAPRRSRR